MRRGIQVKKLLIGVKGLMVGVNAVSQRQGIERLAVEGQFAAIEIGLLLRGADTGDAVAGKGRERLEGQALVAIVNLRHQILAEKVGIGVLHIDQMAFGAGQAVGVEIA